MTLVLELIRAQPPGRVDSDDSLDLTFTLMLLRLRP